jgi:hypothetical protein
MWQKLAFLAAMTAVAAATPATDVETLAGDAARTLAAGRHGVTAFWLAYRYTEHGPAHNVDRSSRAMVLRDDGSVVKMRTFADDSNKPTYVEDDYHLPIETEYLREYRFARGSVACDGCPASAVAIDFTSLKRDDEHGDGTMWIDGSPQRFVALHFHPSVLPPHTDSADITVAFGQVLPDLWDVTVTEQQYNGHTFVFHGWGHVQQRQTEYRRYSSVAEGLTALSAAVPDASTAATPQKR